MSLHPRQHNLVLLPLSLLALLALCSAVIGCGSSSSKQVLTRKEFTAHAEHICDRVRMTVSSTAILYKQKDPNIEEVDLVTKVAVPSIEEEIRRIKALGMPSEGRSTVEAFVGALESGVTDTTKDPQIILATETNPFAKAKAIAAAYGLEVCSTFP